MSKMLIIAKRRNNVENQHLSREQEIIETLAVNYATDANGVFNLPDYIAFMAGVRAGMAMNLQVSHNSKVRQKPSDTE